MKNQREKGKSFKPEKELKINVKEKGKVYDNTAKMQFINQLGA